MKTDLPQEIFLKDYIAYPFDILSLAMQFELAEDKARVTATSEIERKSDGDLYLDGSDFLALIGVEVDGVAADYEKKGEGILLKEVPDRFSLTIITELAPQDNTQLSGLYKSSGNFCTQCEAEGFRRITFFPDRPDVLTSYGVKIIADKEKYPVLLSNGNLDDSGDLEDGKHFALWRDPHPKPSYLFALVAADLAVLTDHYKTSEGRDVTLNIYAAATDIEKCHFAMTSLKNSMKWDEECFGLAYDLDIYNIVAVGDFNMGAMENKGLNVFNTKYVLADANTATDTDFGHVEGVIGHEYFHNWTGNRVTCRDWFQLSLKEGLTVFRDQEFSSDMGSRAIKRIDDVRVLRGHQFPEDGGPMAHPIRPESYIEINNFYTATVYNKGAEVIRMMHTLIGAENFRKGMDLYFERHDGQAVTCEDFVSAMEDASGTDLKQFRLWYQYAGTPEVSVASDYDVLTRRLMLTFEQHCPDTPGQKAKLPMHIPIKMGLVGSHGDVESATCDGACRDDGGTWLLNLSHRQQQFTFENVPAGSVPSILRDFSAPIKVKMDSDRRALAQLAQTDSDSFNRWEAGQRLATDVILSALNEGNEANGLDAHLSATFAAILNDMDTDPALLAEALCLPSETYLGQMMSVVDVDGLHRVREGLMKQLVQKHRDEILYRYHPLKGAGNYDYNQQDVARRRLRNVLLGLLMADAGQEDATLVVDHYKAADNMTDVMAAFAAIQKWSGDERAMITKDFYDRWQGNDLVIDKWFAVQAQTAHTDTLERVEALAKHPDFTIKNPNRLRSLIGPFSVLNQSVFHDVSGGGYRFLADMVMDVDAINPQTAARIVAPFNQFARFDDKRQALMKAEMQRIIGRKGVSKDVFEIVSKGLKQAE